MKKPTLRLQHCCNRIGTMTQLIWWIKKSQLSYDSFDALVFQRLQSKGNLSGRLLVFFPIKRYLKPFLPLSQVACTFLSKVFQASRGSRGEVDAKLNSTAHLGFVKSTMVVFTNCLLTLTSMEQPAWTNHLVKPRTSMGRLSGKNTIVERD